LLANEGDCLKAITCLANHSQVGLIFEQGYQALAHYNVVIGDNQAYHS
jgi:hypothetical protein